MSSFESGAYQRPGFGKLLGPRGVISGAPTDSSEAAAVSENKQYSSPRVRFRELCVRAVSDDGRYEYQDGELFRIIPGKNLYRRVNTKLPKAGQGETIYIRVSPLNSSYLWIGFGEHGLHFSEDGGSTFRQIPNVTRVDALVLKRDKSSEEGMRVQFSGNIQQLGFRKFLSMDRGRSWSTATRSCVIDLTKAKIN